MKISEVMSTLDATVEACPDLLDREVKTGCGSDLMSDVLAFVKEQAVLLTGLVNPQVIRTAEMMDMQCVVFVRGKRPTADMIALAEDAEIVLLCTGYEMFTACGRLYAGGMGGKSGR